MKQGSLKGSRCSTVVPVTRFRFLDGMGVVVAEDEFADHADALVWARADDGPDDEVQRVEYLGPEGDWRCAAALNAFFKRGEVRLAACREPPAAAPGVPQRRLALNDVPEGREESHQGRTVSRWLASPWSTPAAMTPIPLPAPCCRR